MDLSLPPAAERYLSYAEMERFTERMRLFAEACYPEEGGFRSLGPSDLEEVLRQVFED